MTEPPAANKTCSPLAGHCLLRRLAEESAEISLNEVCSACHQSMGELESFADRIGDQLAIAPSADAPPADHEQAGMQQAARILSDEVQKIYEAALGNRGKKRPKPSNDAKTKRQ